MPRVGGRASEKVMGTRPGDGLLQPWIPSIILFVIDSVFHSVFFFRFLLSRIQCYTPWEIIGASVRWSVPRGGFSPILLSLGVPRDQNVKKHPFLFHLTVILPISCIGKKGKVVARQMKIQFTLTILSLQWYLYTSHKYIETPFPSKLFARISG